VPRYVRVETSHGPQIGTQDADGSVTPLVWQDGTPVTDLVSLIAEGAAEARDDDGAVIEQPRLLAPLARLPRNMMCVGKNYRAHAAEFAGSGYDSSVSGGGGDADEEPLIVFTKADSSIVGPDEPIVVPAGVTSEVDYEGELAVVIGKGGRHIARDDVWDHVFGYTIVNDVTARDLQKQHRQWYLGKSLDTFCPTGPAVVTADEVDGANLRLRTWVNGELRQDATTDLLIHDIPAVVSAISRSCALVPGDVIATGTPAGVGIGMTPPVFLADGDVDEINIEGIVPLPHPVTPSA